tara:strand:+ start:8797 stop:9474 length:678 start_codon:yes stop_codon:yes gene_type:complete
MNQGPSKNKIEAELKFVLDHARDYLKRVRLNPYVTPAYGHQIVGLYNAVRDMWKSLQLPTLFRSEEYRLLQFSDSLLSKLNTMVLNEWLGRVWHRHVSDSVFTPALMGVSRLTSKFRYQHPDLFQANYSENKFLLKAQKEIKRYKNYRQSLALGQKEDEVQTLNCPMGTGIMVDRASCQTVPNPSIHWQFVDETPNISRLAEGDSAESVGPEGGSPRGFSPSSLS